MNETMENLSYVPKRLPNTAPNGNTEGVFWHTFVPFMKDVYISDFQISYLNARSVNGEDVIQYSFLFHAVSSNFSNINNVRNNLLPYFKPGKASKNENLTFNVYDFYSTGENKIRLDIEFVNINNMFMARGKIPEKDLVSKEFKDNRDTYLEVIRRIFTMLSKFYANRGDLIAQLQPSFELDVQDNIFTTKFDILLSYQYSKSGQLKNKQNNVNLNRSEEEVLSRGFIEWLLSAEDPIKYIERTSSGVNKNTFIHPGQNFVNVNYSNHNVNVNRQDFNRGMAMEANRNNKADTPTVVVDLNAPSAEVANQIGNLFVGVHGDNLTEFQRVQKCAEEVSNFLNNMKYDPNMMDIDKMTTDFQNRLDDLNNERKRLQQENEDLRKRLEDCEYIKGVATKNAEDIARFVPVDDLNDDDLNDSNRQVEFSKKGITRPNARNPIRKREVYSEKQERTLKYDKNQRLNKAVDLRKKAREGGVEMRRKNLEDQIKERNKRIKEIGTYEQQKAAGEAAAKVFADATKAYFDTIKFNYTSDELLETYGDEAQKFIDQINEEDRNLLSTKKGRSLLGLQYDPRLIAAVVVLQEKQNQVNELKEAIEPIPDKLDEAVANGDLKEVNNSHKKLKKSLQEFQESMKIIEEVAVENGVPVNNVDIVIEAELEEEAVELEKDLGEVKKELDKANKKERTNFKDRNRGNKTDRREKKYGDDRQKRNAKAADYRKKGMQKLENDLKNMKERIKKAKIEKLGPRSEPLKRGASRYKGSFERLNDKYKISKSGKKDPNLNIEPAQKKQALNFLEEAVGSDGSVGLIAGSLIGDPMEKRSLIKIIAEDHIAEAAKRFHKRLVIFLYTEAGDESQCCLTYNNDFLDTVCFYYDSYNNNLILLNTDMLIGLTTERLKQAGLTDLTHVDDVLVLEPEEV